MTKSWVCWIIRWAMIVTGPALLGFSIAWMFYAGLGSDPTSVLVDGLHQRTGLSQGNASNLVNALLLVLLLVLNRKKVGIATVTSAFLVGPSITLAQNLLFHHLPAPSLPVALVCAAAAVLVNGLGLGLYLSADMGASAFDGIILLIKEKTGLSYQWSLGLFYTVVFVIGILMGGVWGIGTLFSLLLCGPFFQFFYRVIFRWAHAHILPVPKEGTTSA